jgi:RHS repeat-associated protein
MSTALRRIVMVCLLCCSGMASAAAAQAGTSSSANEAEGSLSGQQLQAQEPAQLGAPGVDLPSVTPGSLESPFPRSSVPSPQEVAADAQSRTQFSSLNRAGAVALAKEKFSIEHPSWTPPGAEQGAPITKYLGAHSAVETLPNGKHLVVGSSIPLRTEGGEGPPVSMTLHDQGESYLPANPLVPVVISKHLSQGLSFPKGISVAAAAGESSEAPETVGNSVVFANTAPDTDLLVEPVPQGAEVSWQLRSQQSPQDNTLTFNLPPDATLRSSTTLPGGVEVVVEGQVAMVIPPAVAQQADGRSLPTSYAINGDKLTTHVDLSGEVDFPVMLDPILVGAYGTANGANVWNGWNHTDTCGCFEPLVFYNLIQIGANPGPAENNSGEWYIFAPGAGAPGGAGIARVDLSGVIHEAQNQSVIQAGIQNSSGSSPVYSFNGLAGATGPSPLNTWSAYSNQPMAFCAQGAGGHDGGEQPLCDENYSGWDFYLADILGGARTVFNYVRTTGAYVTYLDTTSPNVVQWENPFPGWQKFGPTNDYIHASDQGLGVQRFELQLPPGNSPTFRQDISCNQPNGFIGCPSSENSQTINLSSLATGVYEVGAVAVDAAGNATLQQPYPKLYVDHTAPTINALAGTLAEAANTTIGDGNYSLRFSAQDGGGAPGVPPQSGTNFLEVRVDGRSAYRKSTTCPHPTGIPSSECESLSGEWTMSGQTWGAGSHTVTVVARDWAGNEAFQSFKVTVNEAANQQLGPGSVNLQTGDFNLSSTDVSISAANATLSLTRTYDSRSPSRATTSPLGLQWALSLPDAESSGWESLTPLEESAVSVYAAGGVQLIFKSNGSGGWTSPAGYQTDTLSKPSSGVYQITDAAGNYTQFTQAGPGASFVPSTVGQASGAGGLNKVVYSFIKTAAGIIEPTKILAPEPSEGACTTTLVKGCRALTFAYATTTTATGENQSEWNEYQGRLSRVFFTAWDPAQNKMTETVVEQYAYDKQGRLRAVWDPRISPALKTTYGYDTAGHVTAENLPGQETWALTYGTVSGDTNEGRLLKVTQAPSSAGLWGGAMPANTEAPKLTGTALVGTPLNVSTGTWSGSPVSYAFEWQQCNSVGTECVPILGATNATYTPQLSDAGHAIRARVSALNGGGAPSIVTSATGVVKLDEEYAMAANSQPYGITSGPDKNLWLANYGTSKIAKMTTAGALTEYALPTGSNPFAIAPGPDEKLWFTDYGTSKIGKISTAGAVTEYALPANSGVYGIAAGADKNLWFAESQTNKIGKITTSGTITEYALDPILANGQPFSITAGPDGNVWFTELAGNRIGKITPTGSITEYPLPTGLKSPYSITAGPDGALWFATYGNKVARMTTSGVITNEYQLSATFTSSTITAASDGKLWVTDLLNGKLASVTTGGTVSEMALPSGDGAYSATSGPDGNLWLGEFYAGRAGKVILNPTPVELHPQPGYTVDYGVPVSGAGAPHEMGLNSETHKPEPEKWGQTDDPTYATAIFPPDEAQSWPATDYKRANVFYLDSSSHTVNVASPSGGISTSEYDANNNLTRTLSPDNRVSALAAGSKSAETAAALDTKKTYSSDGTELETTLGPEHNVKLASGSEALARKRSRYSYDENAPGSGGPYRLVTKTTEGAVLANGEERDVRTVKASYSGQEGLGWKLRAPTSSTADPSGLNLTHKTVFDPHTGSVVEDDSPAASSEPTYPPAFASIFASEGAGNGQLNHPNGSATDASGNVWVADATNNRVEKFSASGTFVASYSGGLTTFKAPWGIAINQSTGNVYVADTGDNRILELSSSGAFVAAFGTAGSGALKEPLGIAVDTSGNVWASDAGHNRVVEFTAEGTFLREMGGYGAGNGQLNWPNGIAISEGSVYIVDTGNNRIEQFSSTGSYLGQFGSKGAGAGQFSSPTGIAANPSTGALFVADTYQHRIEQFSPAGRFLTEWATWGSTHAVSSPTGIAINSTGQLFVTDQSADKVTSWTPPEAGAAHLSYSLKIGSTGWESGHFYSPIAPALDGEGNVWVSDRGNNRIQKFSPKGSFIAAYGSEGAGNGQFKSPGGIDVNQSTGNVYVSDAGNHRIEELSSTGAFIRAFGTEGSGKLAEPGGLKVDSAGNVWVPDTSADKIVEFSSTGTFIAAYGKEGSGQVEFKRPSAIAISGENLYITDTSNHRVQELSNKGAYIRSFGINGSGSGELQEPEGIAVDSAGNLYVVDEPSGHVEEFSPSGVYRATFASKGTAEGQLQNPKGVAIDLAGNMYVADTVNNRVEKWTAVNSAAHDTKTIYYSAAGEASVEACRNHPEWANLPCQAQPAQQPQARGLPNLPFTTYAYNIWDEPSTTTDTVGSTTRTTTIGVDGAGRVLTKAITSSIGTPLPTVTNKYSETLGALIEESTSTKSIKRKYNTLYQLESYTDADGNESTFSYDEDGRPKTATDGKGTQTYGYDLTTGLPTSLTDSAAGTFTASYSAGNVMTREGYPNGMSANYAHDPTGQATSLEYVKTTHCTSECVWYSDHVVPSIHGQWLSQTSSLSKESYEYDSIERLTQVQETPTGKGCTTRLYALDEDGNRKSLTTRAPGAEGKCATEGGTVEGHLYDEGDRLADEGVTYDPFGNTTALPSSDAGGSALTSSYYVDDTLASQTQNGQTISYGLDPDRRTRETVSTGTTSSTVVSHYAGDSDSPAWTVDSGGKWTRDIPGIGGGLAAIQTNGATPVLQLSNLHGDIVATAAMSETETKLLSATETTEFGTPAVSNPSKYSWLGADQRSTELPTGIVAMGARTYIPQIGRFEQTDPQPGGGANAYSYTSGDPVNAADPSGEFTSTVTYNYEAADTGAAAEGLSEYFIVAGAIMPPPVDLQIEEEFNAHPPWSAASALEAEPEGGGRYGRNIAGLEDCLGGCHTTPRQDKCLKKAGKNKSRASKCFPGQHGKIEELVEPLNEIISIGKCIIEIVKPPFAPNCGKV